MKSKKWVMVKSPEGFPKESDFQLVEEDISEDLKEGEFIFEALYLSVDPYMRGWMRRNPAGSTMVGQQIGRVLKSANKDYPEGSLLLCGSSGWRSLTKYNGTQRGPYNSNPLHPIPQLGTLPTSLALGVMGMPGATAYFGLLDICKPQSGETVLVNAGAGAVGSLVGQIAKIKGCTVIGYAGTDAKCAWMKELGFDFAFNYKTQDLDETLKQAAPDGIDCYFDNVGGEFTFKVLSNHMKEHGRISVCGSIAVYNDQAGDNTMVPGPYPWSAFIGKQLKMEGFLVPKYIQSKQYPVFLRDMAQWTKEGRIKYQETITTGFESMPKAFFGVLKGENIGKAIVKI